MEEVIRDARRFVESRLEGYEEYLESIGSVSGSSTEAIDFLKDYIVNKVLSDPNSGYENSSVDEVKKTVDSLFSEFFDIDDSSNSFYDSGDSMSALLGGVIAMDQDSFFGLSSIGADNTADILSKRAATMEGVMDTLSALSSSLSSIPSEWINSDSLGRVSSASEHLKRSNEYLGVVVDGCDNDVMRKRSYEYSINSINSAILNLGGNSSRSVSDACASAESLYSSAFDVKSSDKSAAEALSGLYTSLDSFTSADQTPPSIIEYFRNMVDSSMSVIRSYSEEMDKCVKDRTTYNISSLIHKWILGLISCRESMDSSFPVYNEKASDINDPDTIEYKNMLSDIEAADDIVVNEIPDKIIDISSKAKIAIAGGLSIQVVNDLIDDLIPIVERDMNSSRSISSIIKDANLRRDVKAVASLIKMINDFKLDKLRDMILNNKWTEIMNIKGEYTTYIRSISTILSLYEQGKKVFKYTNTSDRDKIFNMAYSIYGKITSMFGSQYPAIKSYQELVKMSARIVSDKKIPEAKKLLEEISTLEKEVNDLK